MADHPAYLPLEYVSELEFTLERDRLGMWPLERLMERVFTDGYDPPVEPQPDVVFDTKPERL